MRILVCGAREWNNFDKIKAVLTPYGDKPEEHTLIHGGCRGADCIAGYIGKQLNMNIQVFEAQWKKYGRGAGPVRNLQMIDEGKPDIVYAFHECIEKSRGTKDMVNRAKKHNIEVIVVS